MARSSIAALTMFPKLNLYEKEVMTNQYNTALCTQVSAEVDYFDRRHGINRSNSGKSVYFSISSREYKVSRQTYVDEESYYVGKIS